MKVLLRAPLLTNSGYGVHSRQVFEWLASKKNIDLSVQCLNWGRCSWLINKNSHDGLVGKIMSYSNDIQDKKFDMSFQVQLPNEWDPKLAKVNVGISAFVETDKCNQKWVENCNAMEMVVVPSTFTKNVVKRSGPLLTKIMVIPEWFNHNILNNSLCDKINQNDDRYNFKTDFNILVMGLLTSENVINDRKNLINTIVWLLDEFKDCPDVGIVLKTSLGKSSVSDKIACMRLCKQIVENNRHGSFPKIHLMHGNMSPQEIAGLYNSRNIKMYVTATRGEGYGLPIIDAAAAGVPIVATAWSGHLEFLKKSLFHPIKYQLTNIDQSKIDNNIFVNGARWAEPDKEDFCNSVRSVYENYDDSLDKSKILQKHIQTNFNSSAIKNKYDSLLDEVQKLL